MRDVRYPRSPPAWAKVLRVLIAFMTPQGDQCSKCGQMVARGTLNKHSCSEERRRAWEAGKREALLDKMVGEAAKDLPAELDRFMSSSEAKFYEYLAVKSRAA